MNPILEIYIYFSLLENVSAQYCQEKKKKECMCAYTYTYLYIDQSLVPGNSEFIS